MDHGKEYEPEIVDVHEVEFLDPNSANDLPDQIVRVSGCGLDISPKINSAAVDKVKELYQEYSQKYNLKVEFNISTLTENFKDIIDPNRKKVFEIYLSEAFDRTRLVIFQRSLVAISSLLSQVTDPLTLEDTSLPLEYKFGMISQLMNLMNNFNQMYEQIHINDSDTKLRNISSMASEGPELTSLQKDPKTLEVMDKLNKIVLQDAEE